MNTGDFCFILFLHNIGLVFSFCLNIVYFLVLILRSFFFLTYSVLGSILYFLTFNEVSEISESILVFFFSTRYII